MTSQGGRSPEEIRADIDRTREDVGDTVEALAAKTDVKGQAQQRVQEIKGRLGEKRHDLTARARGATPDSAQQGGRQILSTVKANPTPLALGGAALVGFLLGRRGRR